MENNKTATWTNYGDVNPIEHGGIFVQQEDETTFRIVKLQFAERFQNEYMNLINDLYVDILESWIDKSEVMKTCGCENDNDVYFAIACTEYYSPSNFGNDIDEWVSVNETKKYLEDVYGITEEHYR